jgi:protein ImuB
LVVVEHDPGRDARAFEPVVAAVESFVPRVEVTRPGTCSAAARGPSRFFGGDDALVEAVSMAVEAVLGHRGGVGVGVADGPFAAGLAARHSVRARSRRGMVVAPGESSAFLAPLPLAALGTAMEVASLVDLWKRLGIRTLGELAALPAPAVLARFGPEGIRAHRLARGLDERPLATRTPPPDLAVIAEIDPPVETVETAAFAAKSLADRLCARLADAGLVLTGLAVEAETGHGERHARTWRQPDGFTASAVVQRVRWQLEGWLDGGGGGERPTAGLTLLRLDPAEVGPAGGRQAGFWGGGPGDERAARALARVQGLLGAEAVVTAVLGGGRSPAEQVRLVPWGDDRHPSEEAAPWPGRIPPPAPATVHPEPLAAEVVDAGGRPVGVTGRGRPTGTPTWLSVGGGRWAEVTAWAGPWLLDERWWDPRARRRRARWQVVTGNGEAHLLATEGGRWTVEATYD